MSKRNFCLALLSFAFFTGCGGKPAAMAPSHKVETEAPKGWVSSGGEKFADSLNPWWVTNTKTVRYCVEVDKKTVSVREARAKQLVAEALRYWKLEFTDSPIGADGPYYVTKVYHSIGIGKQAFQEVACDPNVDLRVQIGYGTLTAEQRAYLGSTKDKTGMAVRTEYDEVKLKGKGFIYIASDLGDHAYQNYSEAKGFWKQELILLMVLTHEIGHTFGVPHDGVTSYLMGQRYLEWILDSHVDNPDFEEAVNVESMPSFFFPERKRTTLHSSRRAAWVNTDTRPGAVRDFFGLPGDEELDFAYIRLDWSKNPKVFEVEGITGPESEVKLGKLVFLHSELIPTSSIFVQLTDKQEVFGGEKVGKHFVFGQLAYKLSGVAEFTSADGKVKRNLWIDWDRADEGIEIVPFDLKHRGIFTRIKRRFD